MWAINVTGTFLCTQYALRPDGDGALRALINLSSQLARAGVARRLRRLRGHQGAARRSRAIALEYGGHGITVNAIAPGGIDTT